MFLIGAMMLILSSCGNDNPTVDCLTCDEPAQPTPVNPTTPTEEPEDSEDTDDVNLRDCTYVLLGDNPTSVVYEGNYTDAGVSEVVNGMGEDIDLSLIFNNADDVNTSNSGEYIVEYSSDLCDNNATRVVVVEDKPEVIQGEWEILPF